MQMKKRKSKKCGIQILNNKINIMKMMNKLNKNQDFKIKIIQVIILQIMKNKKM